MNIIIRQMLAASKFNQAILNLLFINHRSFPPFKSTGNTLPLCFIECTKYDGKTQDTCDFIKDEAVSKIEDLMQLGNSLQKAFDFSSLSQSTNLAELLTKKNKFLSEKKIDLIPFLDPKLKNAIIALLAEPLIENWKNQNELLRDETLLNELKTINGITKWLGITICSICLEFQMVVGDIQPNSNKCAQGHLQCELNLYRLNEEYSNWKLSDNDLPYFITEYIKSKTNNLIQPLPNKNFDDAEIDCYLQDSQLGIECKQYLHDLALNQDITRLKTDLTKKMIRYKNAGIKRVILVTNFGDHSQTKLKSEINAELRKQNTNFDSFEWVNSPISLLKQLDNEIELISKIKKY